MAKKIFTPNSVLTVGDMNNFVEEAGNDGRWYARKNEGWEELPAASAEKPGLVKIDWDEATATLKIKTV